MSVGTSALPASRLRAPSRAVIGSSRRLVHLPYKRLSTRCGTRPSALSKHPGDPSLARREARGRWGAAPAKTLGRLARHVRRRRCWGCVRGRAGMVAEPGADFHPRQSLPPGSDEAQDSTGDSSQPRQDAGSLSTIPRAPARSHDRRARASMLGLIEHRNRTWGDATSGNGPAPTLRRLSLQTAPSPLTGADLGTSPEWCNRIRPADARAYSLSELPAQSPATAPRADAATRMPEPHTSNPRPERLRPGVARTTECSLGEHPFVGCSAIPVTCADTRYLTICVQVRFDLCTPTKRTCRSGGSATPGGGRAQHRRRQSPATAPVPPGTPRSSALPRRTRCA